MSNLAVIGWGSLIWNPAGLPHDGRWRVGGPTLPIEFSRISPDGRLTLIIDPEHGERVTARWTTSPRERIEQVVTDLAEREVCPPSWIGFLDRSTGRHSRRGQPLQTDVQAVIERWCARTQVDGAVWTALPGTFSERTGESFSVERALGYLGGLSGTLRETSLAYLRNAPDEVDTPVRRAFRADPRFFREDPPGHPD